MQSLFNKRRPEPERRLYISEHALLRFVCRFHHLDVEGHRRPGGEGDIVRWSMSLTSRYAKPPTAAAPMMNFTTTPTLSPLLSRLSLSPVSTCSAAPVGRTSPASQRRTVRASTPSSFAKSSSESPRRSRSAWMFVGDHIVAKILPSCCYRCQAHFAFVFPALSSRVHFLPHAPPHFSKEPRRNPHCRIGQNWLI